MDVQYNAPHHGKDRLTKGRKILMHSKSSSTLAAHTTHRNPLNSESTNTGTHLRSRTVPRQCQWRQQKYHDFSYFLQRSFSTRSPGDKAKDTRTTTGQVTRPELTSNLNNFLPGLMKSGNQLARPTKQTGKTVRQKKQHQPAQQPRDQLSKGILRKKNTSTDTDQRRQARARAWASGNKLAPQKTNSRRKNVQTGFRTVLWPVLARSRPWPARFVHLSRELTVQWWHRSWTN
jgi:hypothetical protein